MGLGRVACAERRGRKPSLIQGEAEASHAPCCMALFSGAHQRLHSPGL